MNLKKNTLDQATIVPQHSSTVTIPTNPPLKNETSNAFKPVPEPEIKSTTQSLSTTPSSTHKDITNENTENAQSSSEKTKNGHKIHFNFHPKIKTSKKESHESENSAATLWYDGSWATPLNSSSTETIAVQTNPAGSKAINSTKEPTSDIWKHAENGYGLVIPEEYLGFLQSALNNTEVEIRVKCKEEVDVEFNLEFVIRTSPCAKEFIVDKRRFSQVSNLLAFYFQEANSIPTGYHYDSILYYRSPPQKFSCKNHNGVDLFMNSNSKEPMLKHNVTEYKSPLLFDKKSDGEKESKAKSRKRRNVYPGLNGETIDGGAKISLTSWHPVQRLPIDAIYLLVLKITVSKFVAESGASCNIETEVQWRGPNGYLSAIDYPLLHFYGLMCFLYVFLAIIWFFLCLRHWRDLLRIQFWIGAVIMIGMIEKAVFYAEYSNMNTTGQSIEGLLEVAEFTSCLKRTMAHVLIIIVSVGFGVVKPRLGSTMNQVLAVGACYFLFCSLEGWARVSKQTTDAMKEKQIAKVPLAFLEILIAWWIFSSLVNTMRALRLRRNEVKLTLYRHFTNVLGLAMIVAIFYMTWSLYMHVIQYCMKDWKQLWIDTAFWHVFFCAILIAIMILWRPSQNNQCYAFTPLLDDSEDENEDADDELFNNTKANVYEMLKQRAPVQGGIEMKQSSENFSKEDKLQDDLKWIENNIPTSLAEALMDEDDERELRELEISKML